MTETTDQCVIIKQGVVRFVCHRSDWLEAYLDNHGNQFVNGMGVFHLQQWLEYRGVKSSLSVQWTGWRDMHKWIAAHVLRAMGRLK